jgi:hypothetical protein
MTAKITKCDSDSNGTPVFRPASFAHAGLKTGVPLRGWSRLISGMV